MTSALSFAAIVIAYITGGLILFILTFGAWAVGLSQIIQWVLA